MSHEEATHTAEKERVRKVTWPGGSAQVRKARRDRWCSARDSYQWPCPGRIPAGQEYVRSVMFPNHDASGYDVPVVHDTCWQCAQNYLYLDRLDCSIQRARGAVAAVEDSCPALVP